jgi:hypothetical protein
MYLAKGFDRLHRCTSNRSSGLAMRKRLMGFEPTTFCMASRRSSQLSYSRAVPDSSFPTAFPAIRVGAGDGPISARAP